MEAQQPAFRIVIGTDGSPDARAAAEFALREAIAHQGRLRVVHAWNFPVTAADSEIITPYPADHLQSAARTLLDEEVAHLRRRAPDLDVEAHLEYGSPITVLLDAARDADMIVVGSRGVGRVAGLLLGSVSQAVVTRAECAVLVVPPATGKNA